MQIRLLFDDMLPDFIALIFIATFINWFITYGFLKLQTDTEAIRAEAEPDWGRCDNRDPEKQRC